MRLLSRFEFPVRDALRAQGIEEFLPVREVTARWTDRQVVTTRPLFSGYIFGRFDPSLSADTIRQTRGVIQILGIGSPEAIPDDAILNLRRVIEQAGRNTMTVPYCPHEAGDTVTVARGPFAGRTGVVTRATSGATGATLTIPVEILGRAVQVSIDAADVETEKA